MNSLLVHNLQVINKLRIFCDYLGYNKTGKQCKKYQKSFVGGNSHCLIHGECQYRNV